MSTAGLEIQSAILINAAQERGFAGEEWYENYVFPDTPPAYHMAKDYGGYCTLSFGDVTISLDMFDDDILWPPPRSMPFTYLYVVGSDESDASILFEGEAYRKTYNKEKATYTLYGPSYEVSLLAEVEGFGGDTAPVPRAFGSVTYQPALKLPDDLSGCPTYHKGYVTGTKGVNWHVYDDGVNIDSKVTDNGDGTFKLSVSPLGEVGISGTGEQTTLVQLFVWACQSGRLGLELDYSLAESHTLSHWASGQMDMLSFLSDVAAFFDHFFFIRKGKLYLVSMTSDFDVRPVTESDIMPVDYSDLTPISEVKARRQTRTPVTADETEGVYVRVDDQEARVASIYSYGDSVDHTTRSTIAARLQVILDHFHNDRAEFSMPLDPLVPLPLPGSKFVFVDESMVRGVSVWIRARNITYDFKGELIHIEGEGEVSAV